MVVISTLYEVRFMLIRKVVYVNDKKPKPHLLGAVAKTDVSRV